MKNPNCCFVHFLFVNLFMSFPLYNFLKGGKKKKKKEEKKNLFSSKSVSFPGKQKLIFFFFLVNLFTLYRDRMKPKRERMAILVTNIASIVLCALMVFASIESKSLSIIASILDPFFDLLWGFILWLTFHAMQNPNQHKYPMGMKRLQPVVSHSTQQLWGCIWKYVNVYLNLRLLPSCNQFNKFYSHNKK